MEPTKETDPSLTDLLEGETDNTSLDRSTSSTEFTPAACLTILGAFSIMFCTVGFINAFGVFEEYYTSSLLASKSASDIAWIGSFELFVMFGGTLPVGFLSDKYGPRVLLIAGTIITLLAVFMTSLCAEYYQFFLAQGLLLGVGISIIILPAFATVPRHFQKHRGLALGITVSGSSLGGIIWPIALRKLFQEVGFGWGVRIAGFIMLPLLLLGCIFVKLPASSAQALKAAPSKPDFSVVKDIRLILLAAGMFCIYLGLFSPFFYITTWTVSLGLNADMAFYMVSIINAASLPGRIIPGLLADKLGAFNIVILMTAFSGIVCMCWTTATRMGGIVVLSLAYGLASGAVIGIQGLCVASLVQPKQYGVGMGFVFSILSIAGLIGSPINGQLLAKFGYLGISLFSGLAMLLGAIILAAAKFRTNGRLAARV